MIADDVGRWPDRLPWAGLTLLLVLVGMVLTTAAVGVHHACAQADPPVHVPMPGTARAAWCDALHGTSPWLTVVMLPVALTAAAFAVVGRRTAACFSIAALVCVLATVNVLVGRALEHAITI